VRLSLLTSFAAIAMGTFGAGGAVASEKSGESSSVAADAARSRMHRYAECVVGDEMRAHSGRGVFGYLAGGVKPMKVAIRANALFTPACLVKTAYNGTFVSNLKVNRDLMRGQVFRALYVGGWGLTTRKDLLDELKLAVASPAGISPNPLREFGNCVVAFDEPNSVNLLKTRTGSPEEKAAYAALSKAFADCVAPGSTVKFSKSIMEGAIAEALVVRTVNSASSTQAGTL
jgi:hypothetical protein